jgi:hypothetical protein
MECTLYVLLYGVVLLFAVRAAVRCTCCCSLYVVLYGVRAAARTDQR